MDGSKGSVLINFSHSSLNHLTNEKRALKFKNASKHPFRGWGAHIKTSHSGFVYCRYFYHPAPGGTSRKDDDVSVRSQGSLFLELRRLTEKVGSKRGLKPPDLSGRTRLSQ